MPNKIDKVKITGEMRTEIKKLFDEMRVYVALTHELLMKVMNNNNENIISE